MVNDFFLLYDANMLAGSGSLPGSRTASETLGQSVKSTHWRLGHATSEAAAASVRRPQPRKNTDWRLLQATSEAAADDFVRDVRLFYTLR